MMLWCNAGRRGGRPQGASCVNFNFSENEYLRRFPRPSRPTALPVSPETVRRMNSYPPLHLQAEMPDNSVPMPCTSVTRSLHVGY